MEGAGVTQWEHGDNRFIKEHEEQVFDVWRGKPTYQQSWNPATKTWGTWAGPRMVKGVFKWFADYLFLIMKEKINATGKDEDSVFIPTVEVLSDFSNV